MSCYNDIIRVLERDAPDVAAEWSKLPLFDMTDWTWEHTLLCWDRQRKETGYPSGKTQMPFADVLMQMPSGDVLRVRQRQEIIEKGKRIRGPLDTSVFWLEEGRVCGVGDKREHHHLLINTKHLIRNGMMMDIPYVPTHEGDSPERAKIYSSFWLRDPGYAGELWSEEHERFLLDFGRLERHTDTAYVFADEYRLDKNWIVEVGPASGRDAKAAAGTKRKKFPRLHQRKRLVVLGQDEVLKILRPKAPAAATPRQPRPSHIRRGHWRYFKAERYTEATRAKPKWVEAHWVGPQEAVDKGLHYKVRLDL